MRKLLITMGVVALLGSLPASAQIDLTRYVALGDSTTAGFTHGGLMDCYQLNSWPAVLARQAGVTTFEMPLVSAPGLPPLLQLVRIDLVGGNAVPTIAPIGLDPGFPYNAEYPLPYNNLGVPGANLYNLLFTTGDIMNLLAGNTDNAMHDLILRIPQVPNPVPGGPPLPFTAITQAIALQPTFVTLWIGNNDVLGAVLAGTAIEGITMTPVEVFAQLYPQAVGALVTQTAADIVLMTVLDVTEIPLMTTLPPFVQIPGLGVVPIQGSNGPLSADSRVILTASDLLAQGYGLPIPGAPPLPEDLNLATGEPGYVLRPAEIAAIKAQVAAFNEIIRDTADAFGLPVFDAGGWVANATMGEGWNFGGIYLTAEFLLGGLVGYDAVHKQQLGHRVFAMELVEFLNEEMDAELETIDISEILFSNPCAVPAAAVADPNEVVFSKAAHQRLLDLVLPGLKARPQARPEEPQRRSSARGRRLAP